MGQHVEVLLQLGDAPIERRSALGLPLLQFLAQPVGDELLISRVVVQFRPVVVQIRLFPRVEDRLGFSSIRTFFYKTRSGFLEKSVCRRTSQGYKVFFLGICFYWICFDVFQFFV